MRWCGVAIGLMATGAPSDLTFPPTARRVHSGFPSNGVLQPCALDGSGVRVTESGEGRVRLDPLQSLDCGGSGVGRGSLKRGAEAGDSERREKKRAAVSSGAVLGSGDGMLLVSERAQFVMSHLRLL